MRKWELVPVRNPDNEMGLVNDALEHAFREFHLQITTLGRPIAYHWWDTKRMNHAASVVGHARIRLSERICCWISERQFDPELDSPISL